MYALRSVRVNLPRPRIVKVELGVLVKVFKARMTLAAWSEASVLERPSSVCSVLIMSFW